MTESAFALRLRVVGSVVLLSLAAVAANPETAAAQTPEKQLIRSQIRASDFESETIEGRYPGLILIPRKSTNYRDEKYQRRYQLACHVYAGERSNGSAEPIYRRRFLVCSANQDALPFVKQVAKFLLMLYGERHERIRDDHPVDRPTVNVWLTERVEPGLSPDTGGEEFENQIYLYDIHHPRAPIEWAREIAHEYGHYALPGISGFKSPEEWANGVLGERLFLKWIRDDVKIGRTKADELVFVTPDILDDYYSRVIWPLIRRVMRDGPDPQMITRTNSEGMDYYTGIALYVDALFGSKALVNAMLDTRSASSLTLPRASDFLTAVLRSLAEEDEITLNLPALGEVEKENSVSFYLPGGAWTVAMHAGVLSWRIPADPTVGLTSTAKSVTARKGGWHRLFYLRDVDTMAAKLTFRRRG